ncbi:MAG: calcium-binding protein, partial [Xanthobacteraceae bacterium]
GNDKLYGGGGSDTMYGASGDDFLDGGAGVDKMIGGYGNDTYVIDSLSDVFKESVDGGIDTVQVGFTYTLRGYFENLTLIGSAAIDGTGSDFDNVMTGNNAANKLYGGSGNDTLIGNGGSDRLEGGSGNDKLNGGLGADILVGGSGNDVFVFTSAAAADGDVLTSFTRGQDKFDLSGIDAKSGTAAMDPFTIIGATAFSGKQGELRIYDAGGKTFIAGDVNGDKVADFQFQSALGAYNATDFIFATGGPGGGGGGGTDPVSVSSAVTFTLAAGSSNLTLTGGAAIDGTGNTLDNLITGNDAANKLYGLGGSDTLKGGGGIDRLEGGEGNDWLDGGLQVDTLVGGNGGDTFAFTSVAGANGDIITDFKTGLDKLDFSAIDAKASTGANDAFTLIGTGAFTGVEGQMRAVVSGGQIYMQGDVNGDKIADFQIQLNQQNLAVGDFIL